MFKQMFCFVILITILATLDAAPVAPDPAIQIASHQPAASPTVSGVGTKPKGEWRRRKVPKTKELQERSLYPYYYYDYYYCG